MTPFGGGPFGGAPGGPPPGLPNPGILRMALMVPGLGLLGLGAAVWIFEEFLRFVVAGMLCAIGGLMVLIALRIGSRGPGGPGGGIRFTVPPG